MRNLFKSFLTIATFSLIGTPIYAQQLMPVEYGTNACPDGTQHAGNGYCRANNSNQQYVPTGYNNSCPTGTTHAGAGYCRTNAGLWQ